MFHVLFYLQYFTDLSSVTLCRMSFALSIVMIYFLLQEFLVKNADRVELMAMLGIFGGIVSAIQMYP